MASNFVSQGSPAFLSLTATPLTPAPLVSVEHVLNKDSTTTFGEFSEQASSSTTFHGASAVFVTAAVLGARRYSRRSSRRVATAALSEESSRGTERSKFIRSLVAAPVIAAAQLATPEKAAAKTLQEAQEELGTYGMAELAPTEDPQLGWSWQVEPVGLTKDSMYGKFKLGSEPQVMRFLCPPLWVLSRPNIDYNGAAGTVMINDYGKGDSVTLFVDVNFNGKLETMKNEDFNAEIFKALTQKGKAFIQDLKIRKVTDGAPGYKLVEYTYEIESGAGFSINRTGIASVAQVSEVGHLQMFWGGVVTPRWETMKEKLETIVKSFRIGLVPKGVKIESLKEYKNFNEQFKLERK